MKTQAIPIPIPVAPEAHSISGQRLFVEASDCPEELAPFVEGSVFAKAKFISSGFLLAIEGGGALFPDLSQTFLAVGSIEFAF